MRVCLATTEYPPVTSYSGGIGTQFAALAPALARLGHEVHVITLADPAGRKAPGEAVIHAVPKPRLGRLWPAADPAWSVRVARCLSALGRFDVIFAPEWCAPAAVYSRRKRSGALITNLTTSLEQALAISPELPAWRSLRVQYAIQRRAERAQAERSDGLAASSAAILAWSRRLWKLDGIPAAVVPNMVDAELVREWAQGELPIEIPADAPVVAFSGRLELRKGVDVLAEAMRAVWAEVPETRLVLAGRDSPRRQGTMGEHVLRVTGDHADRVHLLGAQPRERLFPLLARADVVALPSRWENFGLAALEAMAVGSAVVATDAGGFPEFMDDGIDARLVPPANADALARAVIELLGDRELRQRLGSAAARKAERFDSPAIAARHLELFERVAGV